MGREIERKFLVRGKQWAAGAEGMEYRQGYLSTDKERTVRVRTAGSRGILTIKGLSVGASRPEYEYDIPLDDATQMLDTLCLKPLIEKTRYRVQHGDHLWEIDVFHGDNNGLIVAEVELGAENESFLSPDWLGDEVTGERRYYNANLIEYPYAAW